MDLYKGGACCYKKLVGGKTYHLVESNVENAITEFGCSEACSYSLQDDTKSDNRYCFKSGGPKSECLAATG